MRLPRFVLHLLPLSLMVAPAAAAPLPATGTLDLTDAPPAQVLRWTASEKDGLAGASVAGIGDFDGDGRADVAIGEPRADTDAGKNSGAVYVVFAARGEGALGDPTKVEVIQGAVAGGFAGFDVAAAGDVNGDGLA